MADFVAWLARVLAEGDSVLDAAPSLSAQDRPAVLEALRTAYEQHALDVAGPPIAFDPAAAVGAALVLARACWLLVGDDEAGGDSLTVGAEPSSPSAHLSADVTLRFLPSVYRRARLANADGALAIELARLLREWPLSGVLADLDGAPSTPPEFGGHPGLQLLYAERLVGVARPGWVPRDGPAREWVECVYQERGKPVPALPKEETGD